MIKAVRGVRDILPSETPRWQRVEAAARRVFEAYGYREIRVPLFERTELFARGIGDETDIVKKEMYTFEDRGGDSLTLRPEATACVLRAYIEHGFQVEPKPVRLYTMGPMFRYERPQAGRYRQFTQVNAEAIGSDSPMVDAELILLASDVIAELGVEGVRLRLGSLGTPETRAAYLDELRSHLRSHEGELSEEVRGRIEANPLRAFDADHEGTRKVMEDAPTLMDRLDPADAEHFEQVKALLERNGVSFTLDPTLVRGLDYYTRTLFEFECESLGAQSGIGGGGRYDGLIEQLGGPPTPGCGWALGVDRIALALEQQAGDEAGAEEPRDGVFIVAEEVDRQRALALVTELRRAGIRADLDLAGRAQKGQMKQADRVGARYALILGGDAKATLRDMDSGEEREIDPATLVETLSSP
jgi:histidyl-tRNA synthetase